MKIISLTAENVKKLVAVEIKPDGNMVEITGKNGQGKTSVLDSIWWALAGADHIQAKPIRKGAEKAVIKLDLGRLKVERRITEKGCYLTVENEDGARYPSPQKMLDDLIGALSFDPLAFARMKPKDQFDQLRALAKLDIDLPALAAADAKQTEERTVANREAKAKRAVADAIQIPDDLPAERIDEAPLLTELQEVGTFNGEIEARKARREQVTQDIERERAKVEEQGRAAAEFRRQAEACETAAKLATEQADRLQKRLDEAPPLPAPKEAAEVRARLEDAQRINRLIEERDRKKKVEEEIAVLEKAAETCTKGIEQRRQERDEAIKRAAMPVEGLGFGDDNVTFNGIPFEQASSAEQLRVSMAIAMASNPKLRVIRIQDGSLLDEESMAEIARMADEKDYQVWIERVDTSGKVGFIVEDGHVRPAQVAAE